MVRFSDMIADWSMIAARLNQSYFTGNSVNFTTHPRSPDPGSRSQPFGDSILTHRHTCWVAFVYDVLPSWPSQTNAPSLTVKALCQLKTFQRSSRTISRRMRHAQRNFTSDAKKTREKDMENRRLRGQISCAECRRYVSLEPPLHIHTYRLVYPG